MIELIAEPRVVKSWEEFLVQNPRFSISLDGYVSGPVRYQSEGPRLNLNHHEGVDRLSTFCASMQSYVRLKMGLYKRFSFDDQPHARIYINDPDQDSSLAVHVLTRPHMSLDERYKSKLEELLYFENLMDVSSGMFPLDVESDIMKRMAWIFEPYDSVRANGTLYSLDAPQTKSVVEDVCARVDKHLLGESGRVTLDTDYEVLHREGGFAVVRENSTYSRTRMVRDGIIFFVSTKPLADGRIKYSLGKISDLIPIDLNALYLFLNTLEGIQQSNSDRWGGSDTIGGSPRMTGSRIKPDELILYLNQNRFLENLR